MAACRRCREGKHRSWQGLREGTQLRLVGHPPPGGSPPRPPAAHTRAPPHRTSTRETPRLHPLCVVRAARPRADTPPRPPTRPPEAAHAPAHGRPPPRRGPFPRPPLQRPRHPGRSPRPRLCLRRPGLSFAQRRGQGRHRFALFRSLLLRTYHERTRPMTASRKTKAVSAVPVRCAIYTRKSTEEGLDQDFNSLDAQREAAGAYIRSQAHAGWTCLPERYDDGGYTGSNLDRPALQRLLADILIGQIDCVLTHRVDRLSRSLLDFAKLMELFEQQQVAFVSVTQHFTSGTSMGRLVLNVLLSFAQFERELIGERTRDKMAAARRKGKWSGGLSPLGYDADVPTKKLVLNAKESARVRAIFALYLEHRGLLPAVDELGRRRWCNKESVTRKGNVRGGR